MEVESSTDLLISGYHFCLCSSDHSKYYTLMRESKKVLKKSFGFFCMIYLDLVRVLFVFNLSKCSDDPVYWHISLK